MKKSRKNITTENAPQEIRITRRMIFEEHFRLLALEARKMYYVTQDWMRKNGKTTMHEDYI
jgi:hypothetical protein